MLHAVITGDIIDSSKLNDQERRKMLDTLEKVFKKIEGKTRKFDFKIYRGDSYQGICEKPELALLTVLKIKAALLSTELDNKRQKLDARMAIGIGTAEKRAETLGQSDGEAFRNSGQLLNPKTREEFKQLKEYSLLFRSPWEEVNQEMDVLFSALDGLISKWTIEQAEVVYELLNNKTQTLIATQLKKSVGAISERVQNSNWLAIRNILTRYENVIKNKVKNG
ncbi:MAG TPA: SatD family protein [Cytophagaceae bacterium]